MRILYDNKVPSATITASTENADYNFTTAFSEATLARKGRTTSASNQWIQFHFASPVQISYVVVKGLNFTGSTTISLAVNPTAAWSDDYPGGDILADELGNLFVDEFGNNLVDASYLLIENLTASDLIVSNFTELAAQYIRLYIHDPSLSYIELEDVYLGAYLQMPAMIPSQTLPVETFSGFNKTVTGQIFGIDEINYKMATVRFPFVTEAKRQEIITFYETVDIVDPFYMLMWENSLTTEDAIYCKLTRSLDTPKKTTDGTLWQINLEFEEVR